MSRRSSGVRDDRADAKGAGPVAGHDGACGDARKQIKEEAELLRNLTGWSAKNITSNIAKTVPKRYR